VSCFAQRFFDAILDLMIRYVERAYPWLLLAPVLLPVVFVSGVLFPYLLPKTLLFYALSLLTIGAFVVLAAHGRAFFYHRFRTWVAGIPLALLVVAYATSLAGLGFYHSFWSIMSRGDGLLMLTFVVVDYYLILISADERFKQRLYRGVGSVAIFVSLYGIIEWLVAGGRIESTIGNAAFLAGYLGVALFVTLATGATASPRARRWWYGGALLEVVAICLTATRGTMLALLITGLAYLGYRSFGGRGVNRNSFRVTLVAVLLVLAGGVLLRAPLTHVPFSPIARLASTSTSDTDVATRLFTWERMLSAVEKRPLTGYGAEHIDYAYNQFYDPSLVKEDWLDRAHNAFLDYAIQYGIFGFALYLALIVAFGLGAYRMWQKGRETEGLYMMLLVISYGVSNFFVFDTISSWWLFIALLALLHGREDAKASSYPLPRLARPVSWVAALVLVILILPCSLLPLLAGWDFAHGYALQLTNPPKEAAYLEKGFALSTYADLDYGYEAYEMYTARQAAALSGGDQLAAYDIAYKILKADYDRYPYDARSALYLAQVLSLSPAERADPTFELEALTRARDLSPLRAETWYLMVNLEIATGNTYAPGSSLRLAHYQNALTLLTQYEALVPNLAETHYVLANLYDILGDPSSAAHEAALGRAAYADSLATAKRAAGYYEYVKDWKSADFFLSEVVRIDPTDLVSSYDLAKVKYLEGDFASAEEWVQKVRAQDSALLQTDPAFITAITQYEQSH
jgi:O-antigen ligase